MFLLGVETSNLSLDYKIFSWIHNLSGQPAVDQFMATLSNAKMWVALAVLVLFYMLFKRMKKALVYFFWIAITIGINDLISARILKPLFGRLRPCREFPEMIEVVRGWCGGDFSFPSNHASNTAVAVTILWFVLPKGPRVFVVSLGLLVGFSRIYLGVHYPGDVLAGFVLGITFGLLSRKLVRQFLNVP